MNIFDPKCVIAPENKCYPPAPNFEFSISEDYSIRRKPTYLNTFAHKSVQYSSSKFDSHPNNHSYVFNSDDLDIGPFQEFSQMSSRLCQADSNSGDSFTSSKDLLTQSNISFYEMLGRGSFGDVYKVKDNNTGIYYAMKIIKKSGRTLYSNQEYNEVRNIRVLGDHYNLVKLHNVWEDKSNIFMEFDLCCLSLKELLLSEGPISQSNIWWILEDISNGLKFIHGKNFIHLDIKPANLFLSIDHRVIKIGDFGLIYNLSDSKGNAIEGDNMYMAPELLRKSFGKPADIFSLGLTILELLTNMELPSQGPLWHKLRQDDFSPIIFRFSRKLRHLISQMLQSSPCKRLSIEDVIISCKDRYLFSYKFPSKHYFPNFILFANFFLFVKQIAVSIWLYSSKFIHPNFRYSIFSREGMNSSINSQSTSNHLFSDDSTISPTNSNQVLVESSNILTSTPYSQGNCCINNHDFFSHNCHDIIPHKLHFT
ncbi:Membrane-associated tyrosine- and threonine-specific cdc2-inhibitory kinase-like [Oopsacas minuta]|uniref:Membrane-associated tyrosine- and threonine-specific cdc2-inhibitory kinase-like n=1 Tax=Oopsacas minuta TaxID=111878 RepID=A0AAV7JSA7_9METZ|nr:Membrane-associated tyrosine- and threonine-specific cdc2-inhibitory kinase-like [Oopsacas minuta]